MDDAADDAIRFLRAHANLVEIAEQAKAGAEKILTMNGERYVALIGAKRLDYYHQLERERIHLLLIDEAKKGLLDISEGRTAAIDTLRRNRKL